MATGFGLRFSRTLSGRPPVTQRFSVPSTDGTALFKGDLVELVNTMDASGQYNTVTKATSGHVLLGVVQGFEPDPTNLFKDVYRPASTARLVDVIVDPDAIYEVQEDAVGGSVAAATIGEMQNTNITTDAGSTYTGLSGSMLDSSAVTTSAADVKIIGVAATDGSNVAAMSGGAVLEVMILAPAIKATDSRS